MADFCKQCSEELFGVGSPSDFVQDDDTGPSWRSLCEGCGPTLTNPAGECVSETCAKHGKLQGESIDFAAVDDYVGPTEESLPCAVCKSRGFAPSLSGRGCTFCDGTVGGETVAPAEFLLVEGGALAALLATQQEGQDVRVFDNAQQQLSPVGCLLLDDMAKAQQLDGSLPLVAVPQIVMARLMNGANETVALLQHLEMTRNVLEAPSMQGSHDNEIKRRLILTGRELENRARLAHGLEKLPLIS